MLKKQCFALVLVAVMLSTNVLLFTSPAEASENVTVVIDDEFLQFDPAAPPQIINGSTMLPLRAFCNAFGTDEPIWDDATNKITITSGDTYVVFIIGSTEMQYGKIITDANGVRTPDVSTVKVETLTNAPIIVNDRAMIPIRAAEIAFGAKIEWVDSTKTVLVSTNNQAEPISTQAPVPAPTQSVPTDSGPQNIAFEDTAYFKEVSAGYVQDLHDSNSKFAVVVYDGKDPECIDIVPKIKEAAADAQFKIYGYDVSSTRYNNSEKLTWVWELIDTSTTPALILSYAGAEDEVITDFSDMSTIEGKFENLASERPDLPSTPTPEPTKTPEPTETPKPTSTPEVGYKWNEISLKDSEEMVKDGKQFAYIIYDSNQGDTYSEAVELMQKLGEEYSVPVYYTDLKGEDESESFWAHELGVYTLANPSVLFVFSEENIDYFTDVDSDDENNLEYEMEQLKEELS